MTREQRKSQPRYLRDPNDQERLGYYLAEYDGEIRYVDDRLAEFLDELSKGGRLENTVIVVTADHGEEFTEHGRWSHGSDLFEQQLHVPLLFVETWRKGPGRRVAQAVSGLDLVPTLLELTGSPAPAELQGRSLVPFFEGTELPPQPIYFEGVGEIGVLSGSWKLIRNRKPASWMLFDLASDPGETTNRLESAPEQARALYRLLAKIESQSQRIAARYPNGQQKALDSKVENELRSLGYL